MMQPIETAPKDGTKVLAYSPQEGFQIWWWESHNSKWVFSYDGIILDQPTLWMPLPEIEAE